MPADRVKQAAQIDATLAVEEERVDVTTRVCFNNVTAFGTPRLARRQGEIPSRIALALLAAPTSYRRKNHTTIPNATVQIWAIVVMGGKVRA